MAESLTPPPFQNAIAEPPAMLTPRPWVRYFDAVRTQVLALVAWQTSLLATTPPPDVGPVSVTGTAETAARGDHTHGTGASGYTDEQAQDAVAAAVANTGRIQWAYNDTLNQLSCDIFGSSIGTDQLTGDGVTYAKIQNVTDNRVLGRSAGSAGDVQELTVGAGLELSGGVLSALATTFQAQIDALNARLTALEQPNLSEGTPT